MTSVGANGFRAAQEFKHSNAGRRHSATVQYTPNFQSQGAANDLFRYAESFARPDGTFGSEEIEAASGLNLSELKRPSDIERLWDLDGDGTVRLPEVFVGLAHIDFSDENGLNGQITEAGRETVEKFFGKGELRRLASTPTYKTQTHFIHAQGNTTFQDPTNLLEAIHQGQIIGFSDSFPQVLESISVGQGLRAFFLKQRQELLTNTVQSLQDTYQGILRQIAAPTAVNVHSRHQAYLDLKG